MLGLRFFDDDIDMSSWFDSQSDGCAGSFISKPGGNPLRFKDASQNFSLQHARGAIDRSDFLIHDDFLEMDIV